eukprot:GSChrysophyteH1.ASY1.ANO1.1039.1 assembled CDS
MGKKRARVKKDPAPECVWDSLPWQQVDTNSIELGGNDGGMFYGLEELDGNAYQVSKDLDSNLYKVEGVQSKRPRQDDHERLNEVKGGGKRNNRDGSGMFLTPQFEEMIQEKRLIEVEQHQDDDDDRELGGQGYASEETQGLVSKTALWGETTLDDVLVDSLKSLGFETPTPIQAAAIPVICSGASDVVGAAETGSGKTLAFCIPMLNTLLMNWTEIQDQYLRRVRVGPFGLVIVPTRELALQIRNVLGQKQRRQLDGRPLHILIATPGRLSFQSITSIRFLVVDEADRIVEDGHYPELNMIFNRIKDHEQTSLSKNENTMKMNNLDFAVPGFDKMPTEEELEQARKDSKTNRQTLLFSATALRSKSKSSSHRAPKKALKGLIDIVDVTSPNALNTRHDKTLNSNVSTSAAVSMVTLPKNEKDFIKSARRVDGFLRALGINSRVIHSQLQQRQRLRSLDAFQASPTGVMVATDVAARGLDITKITSVLHYDIARSTEVYVHRSGRTARANQKGISISLVSPDDCLHHDSICSAIGLDSTMPLHQIDSDLLSTLREKAKLAKRIFTLSFASSQNAKDRAWVQQNADSTGLSLDDYTVSEMTAGSKTGSAQRSELLAAQDKLKSLLETPYKQNNSSHSMPAGARNRKEKRKSGTSSQERIKNRFVVINPEIL